MGKRLQSTREQMGPLVCIYVNRGDGVISLHRKSGCNDHTSGLWRCDIPDSSGEMQSLYIYISNDTSQGQLATLILYILLSTGAEYLWQLNKSVTVFVTLHTEPNASVPEFTISCRTHGGPVTKVVWTIYQKVVGEDIDLYHETSQLILDTSLDSVYDNRLRVRGRRSGKYFYKIIAPSSTLQGNVLITGIIHRKMCYRKK